MWADEAVYNQKGRALDSKIEIYFDGAYQAPLVVDLSNYLITWTIMEEACGSSGVPWGSVSSNEFNFTMYNQDDLFNPANKNSPYYGKIKAGVMVKVYCRPVTAEYEWDQLGMYFIAEWTTSQEGSVVSITSYDLITDVTEGTTVKMPVFMDVQRPAFLRSFFNQLNISINYISDDYSTLPAGYHVGDNYTFLNNVSEGMRVFIFCDHQGVITVQYMNKKLDVAHTLTDNDQIVEITTEHRITTDYNGIEVYLRVPQLVRASILTVKDFEVPPAGIDVTDQQFNVLPVAGVTMARIPGMGKSARVDTFSATSSDIDYHVANLQTETMTVDIFFEGLTIETVDTRYSDDSSKLLSMNNIYVQTQEQFESAKRFMKAFVANKLPIIEVTARGNPKYELGEKFKIVSSRYNLTFEGLLIRQSLNYNGGLSSTLTFMNSEILEVS